MGSITDRSKERLGTSDVAIIRMRKRMLDNIDRCERGQQPIGLNPAERYQDIRGWQRVIRATDSWTSLEAEAESGILLPQQTV